MQEMWAFFILFPLLNQKPSNTFHTKKKSFISILRRNQSIQ